MGCESSDDKLKLYIWLPFRIEDESQVTALHPDISRVHLPRQKSRHWCFVEFESEQKLQAARKQLRKLKINKKRLKIATYRRKSRQQKLLAAEAPLDLLLKSE